MKTNTQKILRSTILHPGIIRTIGFFLIIASLIILGRLLTGGEFANGASRGETIEELRLEQIALEKELMVIQEEYAVLDEERAEIQAVLDEKLLELDSVKTQGAEIRKNISDAEHKISTLRDGGTLDVSEEAF